jgi:hypothetical protein
VRDARLLDLLRPPLQCFVDAVLRVRCFFDDAIFVYSMNRKIIIRGRVVYNDNDNDNNDNDNDALTGDLSK